MKTTRASIECLFGQADFDRFARLSGDANPIHLDSAFAADTRFGRTVAHGLMLCAILRGLVDQLAPGRRQLSQSVMFPAPTFAGETVRLDAFVLAVDEDGMDIGFEVKRVSDEVATCIGQCRVEA
jgi:acyl dehydratase